jgi:hypothetical protein
VNGVFGAVIKGQRRNSCRVCTVPQYVGSLNSCAVELRQQRNYVSGTNKSMGS